MNALIVEHLAKAGVTALAPQSFEKLDVPKRMTPEEVFSLTARHLQAAPTVGAIYFQGAVLEPIKSLEPLDSELGKTEIPSNTSMLWYVLSQLRLRDPISGYGRLLREWPAVR